MKRIFLAILLILLLPLFASATSISDIFNNFLNLDSFISTNDRQEMVLLAVQETPGGDFSGSTALVALETRQGTGRVFLDTFPLSKIDTQISTRFAKEIACKYIDIDCKSRDFIYTLRSDSGIIGGPSAGAAMSVLTLAILKNIELNGNVAMTGTINSGGIIGPVSGLRYKIDAAISLGLEKVLVPHGSLIEGSNGESFTPSEYGEIVGISVVEVSDLNDAMFEFTGKYIHHYDSTIEIPEKFIDTMRTVADNLCERTQTLFEIMKDMFEITEFSQRGRAIAERLQDDAIGLMARAESAREFEYYYATASFCYGANINLRNVILIQENTLDEPLAELINNTARKVDDFEAFVDGIEFRTISDFEVSVIMKERIEAARDFVDNSKVSFLNEDRYGVYRNLAYGIERLFTAEVWKDFLGMEGREFSINEEVLRESCVEKLSEAQERIQYITLFVPEQSLFEIRREYDSAFRDHSNGEYGLCIAKASRAKANVNVLMSVIMVREDDLEDLIDRKLNAARNVIIEQQRKGVFPIMGYSYYEYAKSLKNSDPISALIYIEQALELSWLDIYFEPFSDIPQNLRLNPVNMILILIGFVFGLIFVVSLVPKKSRYLKHTKNDFKRRRKKRRF